MNNQNEIKKIANNFFKEKEYIACYKHLFNLGVNDFITYGIKKKMFSKEIFWNKFIQNTEVFSELISSEKEQNLLFFYFKNNNLFSKKFENKLFTEHPQKYIEIIKRTESFLDENRKNLIEELNFPEKFINDKSALLHIAKEENQIWLKIKGEIESVTKISFEKILIFLTRELEQKRFKNTDEHQINTLANVYGFIIEFLQGEKVEYDNCNEEKIVNFFNDKLDSITPLKNIVDYVFDWFKFYDSIYLPFCFDDNFIPTIINRKINSEYKDKSKLDKWKKGSDRFKMNALRYSIESVEITKYMIDNNKVEIPKGSCKEAYECNREVYLRNWQTQLFLSDLEINKLKLGEKEINISELIDPLNSYTINRKNRIENKLISFFNNSNSWKESYIKLYKFHKEKVDVEPFLYMNINDYVNWNFEVLETSKKSINNFVELFSYKVKNKRFDRFNLKYSVWEKPYIIINENYIFSPMMFISNNDWFYTFANIGLKNIAVKGNSYGKNSSAKLEHKLAELLKQKEFDVKITSEVEAKKMNGDVDVFVKSEKTTLLIQLKRTKIKHTLKGVFNELINSDIPASLQLNNAEKYLKNKNEIFEITGDVKKIIVSTSFENINTEINGCLKVNYFELITALNNYKSNDLLEFISIIEKDEILKWIKY